MARCEINKPAPSTIRIIFLPFFRICELMSSKTASKRWLTIHALLVDLYCTSNEEMRFLVQHRGHFDFPNTMGVIFSVPLLLVMSTTVILLFDLLVPCSPRWIMKVRKWKKFPKETCFVQVENINRSVIHKHCSEIFPILNYKLQINGGGLTF